MSSGRKGFMLYKLHLWCKRFCNPFNGVMATKVQELSFKACQLRLSTANSQGDLDQ